MGVVWAWPRISVWPVVVITLLCVVMEKGLRADARSIYGRLGLGKDTEEPNLPTQVEGLKGVKVVTVAAGGACSFVVTATGELYGWGMGTNLQLGMSDDEDVWTPERVTEKKMENRRTLAVSVGGQHTALLVSNSD